MTLHTPSVALYFLLLPVFTAVAAIGVGLLFLPLLGAWASRPDTAALARNTRAPQAIRARPGIRAEPVRTIGPTLRPRRPVPAATRATTGGREPGLA